MRTVEYRTAHVPAFLTKLWKLVTDPNSDDLISWNVNGTSFIIYDEIRFAKELLPMYFKHNNMASFVRQLNMYGFRKLSSIDQGGLHSAKHEIEFYHQYFIKNQDSLLDLIKRKIPSNRSSEDTKVKPEYVKELISNIKNLQGKQQNSEDEMKNLRRENKLLWQQLTLLNGRYIKQQAMLQQVVPLFMNMVQSSRRLAIKRRQQPLMIDEGEIKEKVRRVEPPYYVEHEDSNLSSPLTPSPGNVSNRGPVIHDVTEMESSKMFADHILCSPNTTKEHDVIVDSPLSSLESSDHTADSPYTDGDSMEPLNILNCNFQSVSSLAPPSSEVQPQMHITNQPELLVGNMNMSQMNNQMRNMSSLPMSLHTATNKECVAPPMASATLTANGPYQPPLSGNTLPKSFPVDVLGESSKLPSALPPSVVMNRQNQDIDNVLNWMSAGSCENEQNIDNWLGQLIKADNLVAGASLPDHVGLGQRV